LRTNSAKKEERKSQAVKETSQPENVERQYRVAVGKKYLDFRDCTVRCGTDMS
jgi:hypothetical protein